MEKAVILLTLMLFVVIINAQESKIVGSWIFNPEEKNIIFMGLDDSQMLIIPKKRQFASSYII